MKNSILIFFVLLITRFTYGQKLDSLSNKKISVYDKIIAFKLFPEVQEGIILNSKQCITLDSLINDSTISPICQTAKCFEANVEFIYYLGNEVVKTVEVAFGCGISIKPQNRLNKNCKYKNIKIPDINEEKFKFLCKDLKISF